MILLFKYALKWSHSEWWQIIISVKIEYLYHISIYPPPPILLEQYFHEYTCLYKKRTKWTSIILRERERENTKMLFKTLMWNQQNLMIYLVLFHRIILLPPSKIRTLYPSNGPDVNIRNIYQTKSQMNKKRNYFTFEFFQLWTHSFAPFFETLGFLLRTN